MKVRTIRTIVFERISMLSARFTNHFQPSQLPKILKIFIGIIFLWLMALFFVKTFSHPPIQPPPLIHDHGHIIIPTQSPLRKIISIAAVEKKPIQVSFTLPAIVQADPELTLKVFPPLLGRIVSLDKQLGDDVNVGDILFTINSPELAQAISDVEKATSARVLAKQNFLRQEKLVASKITSTHDTEQAQNDYDQAVSELTRASARLKELNVEPSIPMDQAVLVVRSPTAGVVTEMNAAVGQYWNDATAAIMVVSDLSTVYITANLQEKDITEAYVGQAVKFTLDAYSKSFHSKVHYISPILNSATRTVDVDILFENKKGELKPNMFASAEFLSRPHERIVLPITAVIQRGFESIVFVEISPWMFEARVVKVGAEIGNSIEIISGLNVKERVALTGGIILND